MKAMLRFIADNIATIIVGAIVAVWLILAVIKIVKDKKNGGACAGCPYSGSCRAAGGKCKKSNSFKGE